MLTLKRTTAVFSKSYCPYCKATKETLSSMGAKAFFIELDQVGSCSFAPPSQPVPSPVRRISRPLPSPSPALSNDGWN